MFFYSTGQTGEPLFPIVETPVDTATDLTGEKFWPTQPIPQKPAPFVRQTFTEKDINPYLSPEEYADVKAKLATYHTGHMFMPQSKEGTIIFPGFDGGAEWGGPAVDPADATLFVNANEMAWILQMLDVDNKAKIMKIMERPGNDCSNKTVCPVTVRTGKGVEIILPYWMSIKK